MIGQNIHSAEAACRETMTSRSNIRNKTTDKTQTNSPEVRMHTLEKNFVSKMRSELDNVIRTVETRVQDAVLSAIQTW